MSERATAQVIRASIAKLDAARLEAALRTLEQVAAANERCPANDEIGHGIVSALAAAGKIEVEIYGRNFRRVKLLTGANAGKMTKAPPNATSRPYAITDRNGTRRTGFGPQNTPRARPSAPRPLTMHELQER